jgi:hypothetical protein
VSLAKDDPRVEKHFQVVRNLGLSQPEQALDLTGTEIGALTEHVDNLQPDGVSEGVGHTDQPLEIHIAEQLQVALSHARDTADTVFGL